MYNGVKEVLTIRQEPRCDMVLAAALARNRRHRHLWSSSGGYLIEGTGDVGSEHDNAVGAPQCHPFPPGHHIRRAPPQ
jgi:hypothetical protein